MSIDLAQFRQGFFDETDEHIATIEQLLLSSEARTSDREQLDAIFRAAHSIKGGSGTFGFTEMSHLTHKLESLFDRVRQGQSELSDAVIDAALHALDVVREMLARYREGEPIDPSLDVQATAELQALIEGAPAAAPGASAPSAPAVQRTFEILYRALHEPEEKKRAQTYDSLLLAVAESAEMLGCTLGDGFKVTLRTASGEEEIRDLFGFVFVEGDELSIEEQAPQAKSEPYGFFPEAPGLPTRRAATSPEGPGIAASGRGKTALKDESIRVSLGKVDALINLVGEIVTAENILAGAIRQLDGTASMALVDAAEKVTRHTRDLRQIVMSIRMVPISFILGRFPRVVRETAAKVGKEVDLVLSGEDTELDKSIIERVVDPLTHLVRNSIDHGFEMPDERVAAGKPARGKLELRASHVSGNIVIEVIDDGRGLSREKLIGKARSLGWDISDDAPDKDVWELIFAPGFSTASSVTEISGRGVGMDVVRRNVAELGGSVELDSTPGKGTRITIHLPLTLAILDGLTVLVGSHIYVVPIANVVSSLQPDADTVQALPSGGEVVFFGGEPVVFRRLHRIFGVSNAVEDPRRGIIVVVESGGRKVAFLVDALDAQQQLVIKSLDTNFRRTRGIAGATVIDNGKVALILDVLALVRSEAAGEEKAA